MIIFGRRKTLVSYNVAHSETAAETLQVVVAILWSAKREKTNEFYRKTNIIPKIWSFSLKTFRVF